jgi:prepilin-type N-terminal cleavage/methylation domain-containing protein
VEAIPVVNKGGRGFSLIELMVVMGIILLITALALPRMQTVLTRYKLDTSGHSVAGLVHQARLQAVRSNQPAYVQFDTNNPSANLVYVNSDKSAYVPGAAGVPVATTNGGVALQANPPTGMVDQLNAYLQGTNTTGVLVEAPGTPIGFNSRGVPCVGFPGNPAVCVQQDPINPSKVATFLWLMKTGQGDWEALTVTAGGKITTWQLQRGTTGCGYNKCWQ